MTNTILFDLQAAAMAAAANAGKQGAVPDTASDEGLGFSDILAAVTGSAANGMAADGSNEADAAGGVLIDGSEADNTMPDLVSDGGVFGEAMKVIENSDEGVRKALRLLLNTVLKAMRGPDDGTERKTDMFMILSDTGAGLLDGEDGDDLLLGAEIMDRLGVMVESSAEEAAKSENVLAELEELVSKLFNVKEDDDDTDENTAADVLAAMLGVKPEEIEDISFVSEDVKAEAVQSAAEVLRTPMKAVESKVPEAAEKAERLFEEAAAEVVSAKNTEPTEAIPENTRAVISFAALRVGGSINNAAEQLNSISAKSVPVKSEDEAISVPEAAADENTEQIKVGTAENADPLSVKNGAAEEKEAADVIGTEKEYSPENESGAAANAETKSTEAAKTETADPELFSAVTANADVTSDNTVSTEDTDAVFSEKTVFSVEKQIGSRIEDEIFDFGDKDGTKELVLILRPKELGQVAVKLIKENGAVSVLLSAQYEEVGKMMTQRAAYLGSSLSNQNYDVKDVQVVEPGNAAEQMGLNFTDRGFSFAQNESGRQSSRGSQDGYGEAAEIEEVNADSGEMRSWEAKLWTTA